MSSHEQRTRQQRKSHRDRKRSSKKRKRRPFVRRTARQLSLTPVQLFRPSQLAEIFDCDPATIWRWRQSGVLPEFTRVGPGIEGLTGKQVKEILEGRGRARPPIRADRPRINDRRRHGDRNHIRD